MNDLKTEPKEAQPQDLGHDEALALKNVAEPEKLDPELESKMLREFIGDRLFAIQVTNEDIKKLNEGCKRFETEINNALGRLKEMRNANIANLKSTTPAQGNSVA
jgi:hypothetical protein